MQLCEMCDKKPTIRCLFMSHKPSIKGASKLPAMVAIKCVVFFFLIVATFRAKHMELILKIVI